MVIARLLMAIVLIKWSLKHTIYYSLLQVTSIFPLNTLYFDEPHKKYFHEDKLSTNANLIVFNPNDTCLLSSVILQEFCNHLFLVAPKIVVTYRRAFKA